MSLLESKENAEAWDHVENERREMLATIASLGEQLRLTNDKMAEQVRQARWEVADVALLLQPNGRERYLEGVRDANAPKD